MDLRANQIDLNHYLIYLFSTEKSQIRRARSKTLSALCIESYVAKCKKSIIQKLLYEKHLFCFYRVPTLISI